MPTPLHPMENAYENVAKKRYIVYSLSREREGGRERERGGEREEEGEGEGREGRERDSDLLIRSLHVTVFLIVTAGIKYISWVIVWSC